MCFVPLVLFLCVIIYVYISLIVKVKVKGKRDGAGLKQNAGQRSATSGQ